MKKLLLIIPTALLLAACTPSVDDYVEDPELLSEAMQSCSKAAMEGREILGDKCDNVAKAQKKLVDNVLKGLMN